MVKIRLQRVGTKKRPYYRVVAIDSQKSRSGLVIENLGQYQPIEKGVQFNINEDRVIDWLKKGAQPTRTVENCLKKNGIWAKYKAAN